MTVGLLMPWAPHVGERTEEELIATFVDLIAELNPQLVTFNGNSFDLPVLRYRAMVHKDPAPGLARDGGRCGVGIVYSRS